MAVVRAAACPCMCLRRSARLPGRVAGVLAPCLCVTRPHQVTCRTDVAHTHTHTRPQVRGAPCRVPRRGQPRPLRGAAGGELAGGHEAGRARSTDQPAPGHVVPSPLPPASPRPYGAQPPPASQPPAMWCSAPPPLSTWPAALVAFGATSMACVDGPACHQPPMHLPSPHRLPWTWTGCPRSTSSRPPTTRAWATCRRPSSSWRTR